MSTPSKQRLISTIENLIVGIHRRFPDPSAKLVFGGMTTTVADLTTLLQSFVDLLTGVATAKAAYEAKKKVLDAQLHSIEQQVAALVAFIRATFGQSPDALPDFGLAPYKVPAPRTAEEKVLAVQRAEATRVARHTMGPRERAAIHGVVPAPAPAVEQSPPAVSPPPVASAPSTVLPAAVIPPNGRPAAGGQ